METSTSSKFQQTNKRWKKMKEMMMGILQILSNNINTSKDSEESQSNPKVHPLQNFQSLHLAPHLKPMLQESNRQQRIRQRQAFQRPAFRQFCDTQCQSILQLQDTNEQSLSFSQRQQSAINQKKNKLYYFIERQEMKNLVVQVDKIYHTLDHFNKLLRDLGSTKIQQFSQITINYASIFAIIDGCQNKEQTKLQLQMEIQKQINQQCKNQSQEYFIHEQLRFDALMTTFHYQVNKIESSLKNVQKALNSSVFLELNSRQLEKFPLFSYKNINVPQSSHVYSEQNYKNQQLLLEQISFYKQQSSSTRNKRNQISLGTPTNYQRCQLMEHLYQTSGIQGIQQNYF